MKAQLNLIMPNLNRDKQSSAVIRETVPSNSNRQENRYFFITLFSVLFVAATILWLTQFQPNKTLRLPNHLSNLATQLSIASDEIAMLQEANLLTQAPTLLELQENELTPFTSESIVMAGTNCFVIDKQQVILRLIKLPNQSWQVQWRALAEQHDDHDHNSIQGHHANQSNLSEQNDFPLTEITELCQENEQWLAAAHLTNDSHNDSNKG